MDKRIKYLLVVDIETANILEDAIAYDIGFAVADKRGNIYEKGSYMVADMFFDYPDLLETAYYKEKLPQYWADYENGTRTLARLTTVKSIISNLMAEYEITDVYAYNMSFDSNGLNRSTRYFTKSKMRYFFPYGTEIHCIWHMACQVLYTQKTFFRMAEKENWISPSGNLMTSAEIGMRYIGCDKDFEESHTGLEDVLIETQILAKCFAQHKKMETSVNRACWRIPQKFYKEFCENT